MHHLPDPSGLRLEDSDPSQAGRFAAALTVALGAPLLPLVAAVLYAHEQAFTRHHDRLFHASMGWPRPAFPLRPSTELAG